MVIAWLLAAHAAPEPAPRPSGDDAVSEEVIVYGEIRAQQAKEKVIRELQQLGYEKRIDKDGAVVMRHPASWKGDVWLHDDGWMQIRRQPVQYQVPPGVMGPLSCILLPPSCLKVGGQLVGHRKFMAVETRVAGTVSPSVSTWGDRLADLSVDRKQEGLPARLEALWLDGMPLEVPEGENPVLLASVDDRKLALLRFWETRTDNEWGERIRETVEAFIRGEVQGSEHPFTDAEIAEFNRRSRAGRELDLQRRRIAPEE